MNLSPKKKAFIALFLIFIMTFCFFGGGYLLTRYYENFSAITKLCTYYAHSEKYKKIKVHIDQWNEPASLLASSTGVSYNFNKGKLPVNILNTKQLNFVYVDYSFEYIDEFHLDPKIVYQQKLENYKLKNYKDDDFPDYMDSFNYNNDFEIYYSEELWDAFYNPYVNDGLVQNVIYAISDWKLLVIGLILIILSILLYNFLRRWGASDLPKAYESQFTRTPFLLFGSIILFMICFILTIVDLVFIVKIINLSLEDRYANHQQYIDKEYIITKYNVKEDWYEMLSGAKNSSSSSKEVSYAYFYGYSGVGYSNEFGNGKLPIEIYRNRSIISDMSFSEDDLEFLPANVSIQEEDEEKKYPKRKIWYNPKNQKAYLPEPFEEKKSGSKFLLKKLNEIWLLHLSVIIFILLLLKFRNRFLGIINKLLKP